MATAVFRDVDGVRHGIEVASGDFAIIDHDGNRFAISLGASVLSNSGNTGVTVDSSGNTSIGSTGALATNATDGFLYVPTCAGIPTGIPTTISGKSPVIVDSTNNKMYFYSGATWIALN